MGSLCSDASVLAGVYYVRDMRASVQSSEGGGGGVVETEICEW